MNFIKAVYLQVVFKTKLLLGIPEEYLLIHKKTGALIVHDLIHDTVQFEGAPIIHLTRLGNVDLDKYYELVGRV